MKKALIAILLLAGCGHTTQEKMWFGAFVGSQVADYYTTTRYLDIGGTEANPMLDDRPNHEGVALFKGCVVGVIYGLGQLWPERRMAFYQWGVVSGIGAAAWNDKLYEKYK